MEPCLYLVHADERLLYVGITTDIVNRFATHRRQSAWWDAATDLTAFTWHTPRGVSAMEAIEAAMIAQAHPVWNVSPGLRNVAPTVCLPSGAVLYRFTAGRVDWLHGVELPVPQPGVSHRLRT